MMRLGLSVLLVLAFAGGDALAQSPLNARPKSVTATAGALKPFPKPERVTEEQFKARTTPVTVEFPEDDKNLKIEMRLPTGWMPRDASQLKNLRTAERLFGEVAWYDGPGGGNKARPTVTMRSIALDHELTAKSWIIERIFNNAYTMRSLKERSFDDVEAIYVTYDDLTTYVTWARAVINGPRVVLVEFNLPSDLWSSQKDLQTWAMSGVRIGSQDTGRIEELAAFAFLDVATFQYPKSWMLLRNIIRSPDFFRVALFNAQEKETPTVQINVQAARIGGAVSLETMKEEERHYLDRQRVVLREKLPSPNFVPNDPKIEHIQNTVYTVSSRLGLYETDLNTKPVTKEYWLTTFDKGGTAFVISMLVPSRHSMYGDWARATRTYQIVVETLTGRRMEGKNKPKTPQIGEDTAIPFLDQ